MRKPGNWLRQRFEAVMEMTASLPAILSALVGDHVIPQVDGRNLTRQLKRSSEAVIIVVCLFLTILVASINYKSTSRVSFTLFYLLIAAFAAWSGSRRAGILIALAGSLAAFIDQVSRNSQLGVLIWNLGVQTGISVFVVLLVSAVRNLTQHLERG